MADKTAAADYPILDLIAQRWSTRAFADKPVARETLLTLFEAARWAPSSFNEQPWRFIVAAKEDGNAYDKILACLSESNQEWAKLAPVLMIVVAKSEFTHQERPNRHAWYDVGQAIAILTIQATALGIYVHQMAGFSAEKARETYHIPVGYAPTTAVALGYKGDPAPLPERRQAQEQAPRQRKSLSEIVFAGEWEASF